MAIMINKSIMDIDSQFKVYKKAFDSLGFEVDFSEKGRLLNPESMCKNKDGWAIFNWKKEVLYISCFCQNCGNEHAFYWEILEPWRGNNQGFNSQFGYKTADQLNELWKDTVECFSSTTLDAYNREKNMSSCPICGASLSKDSGYYMETEKLISVYKSLSKMQTIRESCDRNAFNQKVSDLVADCDMPVTSLLPADKVEGIKTDPAKLKDYILNLIKLETNIYSITKHLPDMYKRQVDVGRKVISYVAKGMYEKNAGLAEAEEKIAQASKRLEAYQAGDFDIKAPVEPTKPTLETPSLFNKKKVLAENERRQAEYDAQMKFYQESLIAYGAKRVELLKEAELELETAKTAFVTARAEAEKATENPEEKNAIVELKSAIDQNVIEAETMLRKLYACRNEMYGFNVIFGKYRNVVALSTFYEYLMAGRCSRLEGHEGAYNIYESELRANMIIGQLSRVIEKLDEVKESQYLIYSELQTVNKNLNRINKTMEAALESIENIEKGVVHIAENTDVIAYNAAASAHYAKVNAELTNALGFMVA